MGPQAKVAWWERLDGRQFEIEPAALLREHGYGVSCVGGAGDGGVDLMLDS